MLWPVAGSDRFGRHVFDAPVQVKVRWVDTKLEPVRPDAQTPVLDAVAITDRRVDVHSLMWLGTLEEWGGAGSGTGTGLDPLAREETDLMQVKMSRMTPDVKGRSRRYRVGLKRYRRAP